MLLLLVASMLAPGINYATPNQSISENFTNTTNVSEIVENTTNSTTIQNTTTAVVNDTVISQQENQTSDTSNNTQNSSSDNSNQTDTIQNNSAAASDGTYTNVHGIWLNVDDVNNVNVNELLTAGITDVFVKANRISNPTYQSVLTTIINKLQGTEIRIHAWITCFVDANGDWVDPKDSETTDALVNAITDITTNYNIAGIHLDYVRYPGTAYQYSGGTEAITSFVQRVYTTVKSIKAKVAVSAALMPEGAANAYYYGQDYEQLSNYLDFLVPMVYEGNYKEDNDWITSATAYIVNHSTKPVVVGLQTYKSDSNLVALSAEEVKADIESALSGGASGFALFRYGWLDKDFFQTANSNNTTSTTQFTTAQIAKAANDVKLFIEGNKYLPTWITVAGVLVNQGQFMYLLSEATLHIQNGDGSAISLVDCTVPSVSGESLSGGTLSLSAYVKLANEIACFVDGNHQAPSLCKSSLGLQSYQSVIYMYSRILSNYLTDGSLQSSVVVKAWSPSNLPVKDSTGSDSPKFTTAQIAKAANDVKLFIEGNKYLPTWITVAGVLVNQGQFMYLLSEATLHVQNGDGSAISLVDCTVPSVSGESLSGGTLSLSAYVKLANDIACFIDGNHQAPSLCTSSLGLQSYQSVIYMYSRILSNYLTDGSLQSSVVVKAWSPSNLPVKDSNTFTVAEIAKAANDVKLFVEGNKYLPTWITVGGVTVNQGQFLYLLTTCTSQLNSGITSLIALPSVSVASSPLEQMTSGNLDKTEYVDLANRVKSFMDSNGIAPNYGSTSLGKLRFESLLYLYSRVVAFYGQNQYLPNYATMKSWSSVVATEPSVPAELQQYLQATTKCEVNDPRIIALAQSITSGATSSYQKATLIFNWVRDNINYSYYYDSQKGAVGTLTSGSANCCDHSHLVVALSRAAGLPARYVHGYCYFTSSGNWYGHVFAQIYVNGQWYNADATSSRNTLGVINNWNTNTWTYKGTYASLPF
ncbi:pseudomurein-binding repeat-containing protein [Methanobacterium formicicum]|nr:pseudomurein-binding repeat-containing protein [Methanobacterium formicicum]